MKLKKKLITSIVWKDDYTLTDSISNINPNVELNHNNWYTFTQWFLADISQGHTYKYKTVEYLGTILHIYRAKSWRLKGIKLNSNHSVWWLGPIIIYSWSN